MFQGTLKVCFLKNYRKLKKNEKHKHKSQILKELFIKSQGSMPLTELSVKKNGTLGKCI